MTREEEGTTTFPVAATMVLVLLLAGVSSDRPSVQLVASRPSGKLVPSTGVLFGSWVTDGSGFSRSAVTDLESALGRTLRIDHHYYAWNDTFPGSSEAWDRDNGRIPLITWEPWGTKLADIAGGKYDALIRTRARAVKAFGTPIFLRWAHEMNGNWYPWDGSHNGNAPSRYVSAWRRIHGIFRAEGATNVAWVWCPNAESVPNTSWNHWSKYYPGDSYVDWVGIDGYNWGTSYDWSKWRSFRSIFRPVYNDYASRKPIMIAEMGSVEQGGSKIRWYRHMWYQIRVRMRSIAAVVTFEQNKWRADTSTGALRALRAMARSSYFRARADTYRPGISGPSAPDTVRSSAKVRYRVREPGRAQLRVYDSSGRLVRRLRALRWVAPVWRSAKWDTRNDDGRLVRSGKYRIRVKAVDASGNTSYDSTWVTVSR